MVKEIIMPKSCNFYYKYLDSGATSNCFITSDGNVYKEYTEDMTNYEKFKDVVNNFSSDYFVFPHTFIYASKISKNTLIGYLMNYVVGKKLYEIDDNTNLNTFLKHLLLLEKEILELSKENLLMVDMNTSNILYDDTLGFKVIDTDFYKIGKDKDKTIDYNKCEFAWTIYGSLLYDFHDAFIVNMANPIFKNINNFIIAAKSGKISASDMVNEISYYLEQITGESINVVGDINSKVLELSR